MTKLKYFGKIVSNQNSTNKNLKQQITFSKALSESSPISKRVLLFGWLLDSSNYLSGMGNM
jgi:hypothetical protein